jgi:hypothetical protein
MKRPEIGFRAVRPARGEERIELLEVPTNAVDRRSEDVVRSSRPGDGAHAGASRNG